MEGRETIGNDRERKNREMLEHQQRQRTIGQVKAPDKCKWCGQEEERPDKWSMRFKAVEDQVGELREDLRWNSMRQKTIHTKPPTTTKVVS
jgi:hypothetical protein